MLDVPLSHTLTCACMSAHAYHMHIHIGLYPSSFLIGIQHQKVAYTQRTGGTSGKSSAKTLQLFFRNSFLWLCAHTTHRLLPSWNAFDAASSHCSAETKVAFFRLLLFQHHTGKIKGQQPLITSVSFHQQHETKTLFQIPWKEKGAIQELSSWHQWGAKTGVVAGEQK